MKYFSVVIFEPDLDQEPAIYIYLLYLSLDFIKGKIRLSHLSSTAAALFSYLILEVLRFFSLRGHSHITLCPRGGGGGQLKHNIL